MGCAVLFVEWGYDGFVLEMEKILDFAQDSNDGNVILSGAKDLSVFSWKWCESCLPFPDGNGKGAFEVVAAPIGGGGLCNSRIEFGEAGLGWRGGGFVEAPPRAPAGRCPAPAKELAPLGFPFWRIVGGEWNAPGLLQEVPGHFFMCCDVFGYARRRRA